MPHSYVDIPAIADARRSTGGRVATDSVRTEEKNEALRRPVSRHTLAFSA